MPDREKVIKGLEACLEGLSEICPYKDSDAPGGCKDELMYDALALLKAQEPRVMTDTELEAIRKAPLILKPTVDAIPIDWLRDKMRGYASALKSTELKALVLVKQMWEREQEART